MYKDIEKKLKMFYGNDYKHFLNLIKDFSELNKRLNTILDSIMYQTMIYFILNQENKDEKSISLLKNLNWIFLSYSVTEITNIFYDKTRSIEVIFKNLYESAINPKFPKYKGMNFDITIVNVNKKKFEKIQSKYLKEISKIKTARDKIFSHIDQEQDLDVPNSIVMFQIIHNLNQVMNELYNGLGLHLFEMNTYQNKEADGFSIKRYIDMFFSLFKGIEVVCDSDKAKIMSILEECFKEQI